MTIAKAQRRVLLICYRFFLHKQYCLGIFCSQVEIFFSIFLDCAKINIEFIKQCKRNMIVIGIDSVQHVMFIKKFEYY